MSRVCEGEDMDYGKESMTCTSMATLWRACSADYMAEPARRPSLQAEHVGLSGHTRHKDKRMSKTLLKGNVSKTSRRRSTVRCYSMSSRIWPRRAR